MESGEPPPKLIATHRNRSVLAEGNQTLSSGEAFPHWSRGEENTPAWFCTQTLLYSIRGMHTVCQTSDLFPVGSEEEKVRVRVGRLERAASFSASE